MKRHTVRGIKKKRCARDHNIRKVTKEIFVGNYISTEQYFHVNVEISEGAEFITTEATIVKA